MSSARFVKIKYRIYSKKLLDITGTQNIIVNKILADMMRCGWSLHFFFSERILVSSGAVVTQLSRQG
jgi:hypothetical protein